jgi:RNA polymerase sigma-70 factor, ECF subfamily
MTLLTMERHADAGLMAAFLQKEPAAAAALYDRFASRIYGLGLVMLKNKTDAEDLVQDTFLKLWRRGSGFDPQRGSLDVWILMVARNLAIDVIRRRTLEAKKLSTELTYSEASVEPGPEWHAEQRDLMRHAQKAMEELPAEQRSALELTYLGERSSTEVAALEHIPQGTVKSRVRAGLSTLRKSLSENDSEPSPTLRSRRVEELQCCGGAA